MICFSYPKKNRKRNDENPLGVEREKMRDKPNNGFKCSLVYNSSTYLTLKSMQSNHMVIISTHTHNQQCDAFYFDGMRIYIFIYISTTLCMNVSRCRAIDRSSLSFIDFNDRVCEKLDHLFFTLCYLLLLCLDTFFFSRSHIVRMHFHSYIERLCTSRAHLEQQPYNNDNSNIFCKIVSMMMTMTMHISCDPEGIPNEIMIVSAAVLLHYQKAHTRTHKRYLFKRISNINCKCIYSQSHFDEGKKKYTHT